MVVVSCAAVLIQPVGKTEEVFVRGCQDRAVIGKCITNGHVLEDNAVDLFDIGRICDVEHGAFQPFDAACVGICLPADTEQFVFSVEMKVFGEAGDLKFADDLRFRRVRKIC